MRDDHHGGKVEEDKLIKIVVLDGMIEEAIAKLWR